MSTTLLVGHEAMHLVSLSVSLSPFLLTLWCRFDLDSALLSSDSFCKHGSPTFHLHERRAVICFSWSKGVSGCEMHRRMSVQYRNSAVSKQSVYKWRFKNGYISIKHKEGAGPRTKWNSACVAYLFVQNLFFFSGYKVEWNNGPSASTRKGPVLKNEVLVRSVLL